MGQFLKYIWYYTCGWPCRFFCLMFFGMRFFGVENIPKKGGFILLCNHQCWLDPMFVVVPVVRRCVFAARDSLFRVPLFGWFFKVYNCIPIKRNHSDIAAIRECIEKLKSGFGLVLYPEGTRTANGKINRLKPGFNLLAKRASVPIIPVVIDGAFESWPRSRRIFSPGRVFIQYGEPINPQEIAAETDKEFMAELNQRMRKMQAELRIKAGRVPFDYTPCEKPGNLSQEDKSVLPDQQTSQQPQKISFFKSAAKKLILTGMLYGVRDAEYFAEFVSSRRHLINNMFQKRADFCFCRIIKVFSIL